MADRTPLLMTKDEEGQALKADEQMMVFKVWSEYVNEDHEKSVTPKLGLFRVRGSVSQFEFGKLSGFVIDSIKSMWPSWDRVKDVELAKKGIEKTTLRANLQVEGVANERTNTITKHMMTATPDRYAYKPADMKGSFGYDPDIMDTIPMKKENVEVFCQALQNQMGNTDTMGDASAGKVKYLWSPLEAGSEEAMPEVEEYAKNLEEFKSWVSRIVHWEYEEWQAPAKRSA